MVKGLLQLPQHSSSSRHLEEFVDDHQYDPSGHRIPIEGPRVSVHLDLPIRFEDQIRTVVFVKHQDICPLGLVRYRTDLDRNQRPAGRSDGRCQAEIPGRKKGGWAAIREEDRILLEAFVSTYSHQMLRQPCRFSLCRRASRRVGQALRQTERGACLGRYRARVVSKGRGETAERGIRTVAFMYLQPRQRSQAGR